jgi:acetylglutamate kinase
MIIIGDSHARGYAANISSHYGKDVDVMGTVMPGARLEDIIKTNIKEISALGKKDIVIICGGSTDINKNEDKVGLSQLMKLVIRFSTHLRMAHRGRNML